MRINSKIVATVFAASLALGSMTAPASAFGFGPFFFKPYFFKPYFFKPHFIKPHIPHKPVKGAGGGGGGGGMSTGAKIVGACVFGGALGLISAALAKGQAYNNDKIELTRDEAWTIAFSCGLGTFPVIANFPRKP